MAREIEFEEVLKNAIENSSVGEKISLNFRGIPQRINVEMTFMGGLLLKQLSLVNPLSLQRARMVI
jgi:hypothetical protein